MRFTILTTLFFFSLFASAQTDSTINVTTSTTSVTSRESYRADEEVYIIKPKIDYPLTVAATAWTIYGFSKIYNKDTSTTAQIMALRRSDVNRFDRKGIDKYSEDAAAASDLLFYGSMPLPFVLLLDKKIRKDAPKIGLLYLEAMSVTGTLYTTSNMLANRYRPLAYNQSGEVAPNEKRRGGSKNSFFAGHPALVATSTFFTAKVFADYNSDSKLRHLFYGLAAASTISTGYLRHRAGKHFPSDIITGTAVGTAAGLLVPHFHKNPVFKNRNMSLLPYSQGDENGLYFAFRF